MTWASVRIISDAPSDLLVTRSICTQFTSCHYFSKVCVEKKTTHPRNATQHALDAAEDDRADEREADLPRDDGDLALREMHERQEGQSVREHEAHRVRARRALRRPRFRRP